MSNYGRPFVIDPQAKSKKQQQLVDTEKSLLNKFNKDSEGETVKKTILDESINDIFDNYSIRMANIVEDVVKVMNNYEPDNARRHSYIGILMNMVATIFDVLTRPDNIIYSGLTLIFISVFIYYLFIAS